LGGFKFRRQHRIGPYFARFLLRHAAPDYRIAVRHTEPPGERRDELRTAYLKQQGYRVLQFWNEQVTRELESVLAIYAAVTDS